MRQPSYESVRERVAGLCRAHGYRLIALRRDSRKSDVYLIVFQWDPMYGKRGSVTELKAKLADAHAVVHAYVTAAKGVYFLPRR